MNSRTSRPRNLDCGSSSAAATPGHQWRPASRWQPLLAVWPVAIAVVLASPDLRLAAADRPNIVLIMADDVGVDAIGCYGGRSHTTARIDQLAADGARFLNCHVMPVCHPTRTTLLTGRYPFRNNHPRWGDFPRLLETETFAAVLHSAGYKTAVAGKWQLALLSRDLQQPHRMGFDEYCLFGWHEGPRYYDPLLFQNGSIRQDTRGLFGPDEYCDFLIDFMRRHRTGPFLAYYPMAVCHDVTDDLDKPVPYGPGKDRYDSFAEMMIVMDRCVGRIVDAVDDLGLREKTIILFLTDNGTPRASIMRAEDGKYLREPVFSEFKDERVQGGKGTLTDLGTHVPLLVRWPGRVAPGSVEDQLIDVSDFFPTLLELAGVASGRRLPRDGTSFAGTLIGQPKAERTWIFAEHGKRDWVRTVRFKHYSDDTWFDLQNDPRETRALDDPANQVPADIRELLASARRRLHEQSTVP